LAFTFADRHILHCEYVNMRQT